MKFLLFDIKGVTLKGYLCGKLNLGNETLDPWSKKGYVFKRFIMAEHFAENVKTDSVQSSSNYLQKLFTKNLLTAR